MQVPSAFYPLRISKLPQNFTTAKATPAIEAVNGSISTAFPAGGVRRGELAPRVSVGRKLEQIRRPGRGRAETAEETPLFIRANAPVAPTETSPSNLIPCAIMA